MTNREIDSVCTEVKKALKQVTGVTGVKTDIVINVTTQTRVREKDKIRKQVYKAERTVSRKFPGANFYFVCE